MVTAAGAAPALEEARRVAGAVPDPELPFLTLADLGILRGVTVDAGGAVLVRLTPTYSGCPATEAIAEDVRASLVAAGFPSVRVRTELAPAWTTDDISEEGRRKMAENGLVPPPPAGSGACITPVSIATRCPACGSLDTELVSRFSSTACKALWRCRACAEPFEQFKAI